MRAANSNRPPNSHVAEPFMSILNGWARAVSRPQLVVEREVHRGDERPEGDGWTCVKRTGTGTGTYTEWERWSTVGEATHHA